MSQLHSYPVSVKWSGGRGGQGTVRGEGSGLESPISVGKEFGGPGNGTNPEELLAEAVASCYTMTFGIIAENRKIPYQDLQVTAEGVVEQNGMQFVYKSLTVRPFITLAADATDEQIKMAEDMAHKADLYCIITNAVRDKVAINVEPTIQRA